MEAASVLAQLCGEPTTALLLELGRQEAQPLQGGQQGQRVDYE